MINPSDLLDEDSSDDESSSGMPGLFIYDASCDIFDDSSSDGEFSITDSVSTQTKHDVSDYNPTSNQDNSDDFSFTLSDMPDSEKHTFYHFVYDSESDYCDSAHPRSDSDASISIPDETQ